MLAACIPKSLFASDASEVINLDSAEWVKENLPSQVQEYRSSYYSAKNSLGQGRS